MTLMFGFFKRKKKHDSQQEPQESQDPSLGAEPSVSERDTPAPAAEEAAPEVPREDAPASAKALDEPLSPPATEEEAPLPQDEEPVHSELVEHTLPEPEPEPEPEP
ncbi:signal recognition particle-docking protein FtsY, partial [Halomonas sp. 141]